MELLDEITKPNSNIEMYLENLEGMFNQEIEKISFMKMRITNFKKLLEEESLISEKLNSNSNVNISKIGNTSNRGDMVDISNSD